MFAMSWQRPRAPLYSRVLTTQMLGIVATCAASVALSRVLHTPAAYSFKSTVVFAAICLIALRYVHHHPFERFGAANVVTTVRALLVSLVIALIGEAPTAAAAWAAALGSTGSTLLDGVDGWMARREGMSSDFGARYDMEIDALLILALAALTWQTGKAGAWIVLAGAMRYLFVAAGYVWHWMTAPLPPSTRRKAACVIQIVGLSVAVAPFVPVPFSRAIALVTLVSLTWSFGVDVLWLRRQSV